MYTSFKILAPLAKKIFFSTLLNFKIPSREAVTIIYTNDSPKVQTDKNYSLRQTTTDDRRQTTDDRRQINLRFNTHGCELIIVPCILLVFDDLKIIFLIFALCISVRIVELWVISGIIIAK